MHDFKNDRWTIHLKCAIDPNRHAFFLIGGHLFYFNELHGDWLSHMFKIPDDYANVLRYALPRGRASAIGYNLVIEASPQLIKYREQISRDLNLIPQDRPRWHFDSHHYGLYANEKIIAMTKMIYQHQPDDHAIQVMNDFIPGLQDAINYEFSQKQNITASIKYSLNNWFKRFQIQPSIQIENDVYGFHHGQMDAQLIARIDGEPVGVLQYVVYQDEASIQWLKTHPDRLRQGIATSLMKYLEQLARDEEWTIRRSATTPDGTAFFNAYDKVAAASYWYHVTTLDNAYDIASGSLDPHPPDYGNDVNWAEQYEWPDGGVEDRTYFGKSQEGTEMFARDYQPVYLRISESIARQCRPGEDCDLFIRESVPAEQIEIQTDAGWMPLKEWTSMQKQASTFDEFLEQHQEGPLEREDYAEAWVPIKHPRGTPNSIEFTPYVNSKGAGVFRWNDEEGIGRAILAVDDQGQMTDLAVQKEYRGMGLSQKLMAHAKVSGQWKYPEFKKGPATVPGLGALHRFIDSEEKE